MPNYTTNTSLSSFQKNIYSQFGEDGIIEEVLNRIGRVSSLDGWCVEFGAWDGILLSNTYNLIRNKKYKAVLIEGDRIKHEKLCKNIPSKDIVKVCQMVTFDGGSTLDCILKQTSIPKNFDFLSIDIDGCDYFILDSLTNYHPKIICIEYNPTIPNDVEFVQPKDFSIKQGSSAKSLTKLAVSKGYSLIATTHSNLIFVQNSLKNSVVGAEEVLLEELRDDSEYKTYVFSGYDGTIFTSKPYIPMPWHGIRLDSGSLQQLPKYLRKYPADYNLLQKTLFILFSAFKFPKLFREFFTRKYLNQK